MAGRTDREPEAGRNAPAQPATGDGAPDEVLEPSERELVVRAQAGDREAFGVLVRRFQQRLFGLGYRYFGQAADAEDLVQETFLRAWRSLDRFDADRPLAPWLLRIASNRALTELESRRRHPGEELSDETPSSEASPEENLERNRLHAAVCRAVAELPEEQKMILTLRTVEGLSYREIADTLDVPIGTVMSRLSRARESLRRRVPR